DSIHGSPVQHCERHFAAGDGLGGSQLIDQAVPRRRSAERVSNISRPVRNPETLVSHQVPQMIYIAQLGLRKVKLHQAKLHTVCLVLAVARSNARIDSAYLGQSLRSRSRADG